MINIFVHKADLSSITDDVGAAVRVPSMSGEMRRASLTVLLILSIFPSVCQGVVVTQTPTLLFVKEGSPANMTCSQDTDYVNMLWYQQKPGEGLKLMIQSLEANTKQRMEPDFELDWKLVRNDIKNSILQLISSKTQDLAVYFCATSHRMKPKGGSWH
ncbi:T-cell receptor beta chain V region LB2 [Pelobates cultripes]|nr:T-cell receptor beta chain V region LB2 [Pelobates cultripes]